LLPGRPARHGPNAPALARPPDCASKICSPPGLTAGRPCEQVVPTGARPSNPHAYPNARQQRDSRQPRAASSAISHRWHNPNNPAHGDALLNRTYTHRTLTVTCAATFNSLNRTLPTVAAASYDLASPQTRSRYNSK